MYKGKIILVPFPFTNLTWQKIRPALVLQSSKKGEDFIACFISSKPKNKIDTLDIRIKPTNKNGLKTESIIKISKLATLEKKIALGEIGELDTGDLNIINQHLKKLFEL